MKKTRKLSKKQIETKLWKECRRVADILYPPKNGVSYCYTCNKPIDGVNKQLGHFIPRSVCGAYLKYDVERNLRWQCYHCNINCGGNGAIFCRRMIEEKGQDFVDSIFALKNQITKAEDRYLELLELYKEI